MNQELHEHYIATLEIRKQTLANLQTLKAKYIADGGNDSFLIEMYDDEIAFATKSVEDMENLLNLKGDDSDEFTVSNQVQNVFFCGGHGCNGTRTHQRSPRSINGIDESSLILLS